MRCHYEVLNVPKEVSDDDLKKAYRKLALKWHPDKNPTNIDEAKREFILVQQAYEVLSDPQERAWYDRHRESILKGAGSGYKDDSLDIYPYFSVSCFRGYDDSNEGFYTIYREVFNKLAAEESEYLSEDDADPPEFGNSESSYEVVKKFYGFWLSFCTKKSYSWLNTYDISEADNRRILRLMEQENKKVRDRAKKERNEEIRALAAFVRKRDKRVHAYAEYLKQKTEENNKKTEENRRKMMAQHRKDIESYKESEWSKFSNLENELKDIESSMASEFNDQSDDSDDDDLLCVACNKYFKTEKAFANHEKSKKHKENVAMLKESMNDEDRLINGNGCSANSDDELAEELSDKCSLIANDCDSSDAETANDVPVSKRKDRNSKSKKKKKNVLPSLPSDHEIDLSDLGGSKKQRRKLEREKILTEKLIKDRIMDDEEEPVSEMVQNDEEPAVLKSKKSKKKKSQAASCDNETDLAELVGSKRSKKKLEREKSEKLPSNEDLGEASKCSKKDKKKKKNEGEPTTSCIEKHVDKSMPSKLKSDTAILKPTKLTCEQIEALDLNHECAACNESFNSKNKLFQHLKTTGHQMFLPTKGKPAKTKKKK